MSIFKNLLKRTFDVIIALIALILGLPLLILISIIIFVNLGTPIFFTQDRVGKNNKIFKIIKFRSMLEPTKNMITDEQRLTTFGKFLRSTSLDELPELINILKGDMSLVGPRPLLVHYIPLYSDEQARRHEILPGITGWAQINGRNAISWEEKFKLDVWYVDNHNFWLDIKIIALTAIKILRREGVNAKESASMPQFLGSKKDN